MDADPLNLFLPVVGEWFRQSLGTPTPAQRLAWPVIAAGKNTLLLAPTGSGKTLAAFLACLDQLWRQEELPWGVQVLYVSPLKALSNDIHRNLQIPLREVTALADGRGIELPELRVAVRTGDTPTHERQKLLRKPPHVLITTPESLHLLLTTRARETLGGVRYCIIDEIHAVCPNKRGVFLALLLERLEEVARGGFVRIGLSATQRPLDEVARYLGGATLDAAGRWTPRPVTIVDSGMRKDLDLQVVSPVPQFGPLPERTVWPSIYRRLLAEIRQHRSTIVFATNRRTAERVTNQLNELAVDGTNSDDQPRPEEEVPGDSQSGDGAGAPVARAHHGSVALEVRQEIEESLKAGRLEAVVATASLELGIDMGAVDLVCQVESPGSIARGLQRVGRAGHLVGQRSKGRLLPKTLPDLLEQAVLAREMMAGRVEHLRVPVNCLDILAQQVIAMVACESWDVPALYGVVRRAYPYRDLSPAAFESVLDMVSGRYPSEAFRDLRPRISWDRVHNRLHALPGSQQMALVNGGTIPDTGQFAAYIADQDVRIGELDEEFVYERRIGDAFVLGTHAWRIEDIGDDRVHVSRAQGSPAMMPFWRGEHVGRTRDLGLAIGRFLRDLQARLPEGDWQNWLTAECRLDEAAARNLGQYVRRQIEQAGCLPTDRTVLVEAFRDQLGDWHVAILTPLGYRFHLALRLVLESRFRERHGYKPQCVHHDDGVLLRLPDIEEPPLDLLIDLDPAEIENRVVDELGDGALFAIRFRQNAARALLMPRNRPDRRAPLWLQRLKARSLLQIARQYPQFPVVVETYRECLQDHLDLAGLVEFVRQLRLGEAEVVQRRAESPSPFAASLLFNFQATYMYEYDRVDAQHHPSSVDRHLLDEMIQPGAHGHLLDARAVEQVERRLRGVGLPPRTREEMAGWLLRLGDLAADEVDAAWLPWLDELQAAGRVVKIQLPRCRKPDRWILTEDLPRYQAAFGLGQGADAGQPRDDGTALASASVADAGQGAEFIVRRFLDTHALVGLQDILDRYPLDADWAREVLQRWVEEGQVSRVPLGDEGRYASPANLAAVQRTSLALRRREVMTCPPAHFVQFLVHWQHRHPAARRVGPEGLRAVLGRLEGLALPAALWERTVIPGRVEGYQGRWLDELTQSGEWLCAWEPTDESDGRSYFIQRASLPETPPRGAMLEDRELPRPVALTYECLRQRGACFALDIIQQTGLPPSQVREALWRLLRAGLATNDHHDVLRRGPEAEPDLAVAGGPAGRRRVRRPVSHRPEGRWSLIAWGAPDAETLALHQARLLLQRYGVVARELALLDPSLVPWRVLYEVFTRLEWAGEIRRGYFVEGLAGAQFALPEAAEQLAACRSASDEAEPLLLLHAQDPANLYGSGAPFAMECSEGAAPVPFARRPTSWLVLRAGKPVLIVEGNGRRLMPVGNVGEDTLRSALECLRDLLRTGHGLDWRGRITVQEWGDRPVTQSAGVGLLEAAGFVADYQAMTLYAVWP